jgi:hypothetical protein
MTVTTKIADFSDITSVVVSEEAVFFSSLDWELNPEYGGNRSTWNVGTHVPSNTS